MKRVEFDSTLDEVVDANMRLVQHTAAYRRQRRQWQWVVGLCVAAGLAVGILRADEARTVLRTRDGSVRLRPSHAASGADEGLGLRRNRIVRTHRSREGQVWDKDPSEVALAQGVHGSFQ